MASQVLPSLSRRFHDLSLAINSILGFWFFYFLTVMVRAVVIGQGLGELLGRRTAGIGVGVILTFGIYLAIRLLAPNGSLKRTITVAAIAGIPAALLFSIFGAVTAFYLYAPLMVPSARELLMQQAPRQIADGAVTWYFFFAAWASFYVAMSAATQLRNAERRASEFERAAQSAQLRALRYQVNPHFLFNTLNSLSSLIMSRREDEAERMILSLSNFFRSTLAIDPTADVSLAEEIRFQMLYLDIEKARFPSRLQVETDIPESLLRARLPALLLQPIIENAIKYGVARAKGAVKLSIGAREADGSLVLTVHNSGDPTDQVNVDHGTGVGLVNVCERLSARFGKAAQCRFGADETGGFRVTLTMPLVRND